ncbi:MAG: hypothetical protein ACC726_04760 [Chloroflexota bacterium]
MSQQLSLPLESAAVEPASRLPARMALPVATEGGAPFDDGTRFFEPWWPGAHALLRRSGSHVEIHTEHLSDPLVAFPQLRHISRALAADGIVMEGTLMALDPQGRPDVRLLRRRLSGSSSAEDAAEGAFVACDLPYLEGRSLARQPFSQRRQALASILGDSPSCVLGPGLTGEGVTMGHAVAALGLDAISARRLDGRWRSGPVRDAWLRLAVSEMPQRPTRPFLVLLEKLPLDG